MREFFFWNQSYKMWNDGRISIIDLVEEGFVPKVIMNKYGRLWCVYVQHKVLRLKLK